MATVQLEILQFPKAWAMTFYFDSMRFSMCPIIWIMYFKFSFPYLKGDFYVAHEINYYVT